MKSLIKVLDTTLIYMYVECYIKIAVVHTLKHNLTHEFWQVLQTHIYHTP